ncbi:MAG: Maf family protein [Steroidobacteraceae bacterium]
MCADFVYLASASPRRRQLLEQIGVRYQTLSVSIDESAAAAEAPRAYVSRLAEAKAEAGRRQAQAQGSAGRPVLAADTAVLIDGEILGKPTDAGDAERMLLRLSGRTHEVLTAVSLATSVRLVSRVCRSEVTFRAIGAHEAHEYWNTGEPCDKAGGYAIQGCGAVFVADLRGSYSGVMGLPLYETAELLKGAGVPIWRPSEHRRSG